LKKNIALSFHFTITYAKNATLYSSYAISHIAIKYNML